MTNISFISYLRVSTDRQGKSGLGLEGQREAVARYVAQTGGTVVEEFVEVESGKRSDRQQLASALASSRARRAVLVIAKLDRLARNSSFLMSIVDGAPEGNVVFCDFPNIPKGAVGRFMLQAMANVAELEAGLISERTRTALAAAKARGVKLGNPKLKPGNRETASIAAAANTAQAKERAAIVAPYIVQARFAGATTLAQVAQALTARGIATPSGSGAWHPVMVSRIMSYVEA
jgi:DNA invertase Pin-like site-specific DNA recombinase